MTGGVWLRPPAPRFLRVRLCHWRRRDSYLGSVPGPFSLTGSSSALPTIDARPGRQYRHRLGTVTLIRDHQPWHVIVATRIVPVPRRHRQRQPARDRRPCSEWNEHVVRYTFRDEYL